MSRKEPASGRGNVYTGFFEKMEYKKKLKCEIYRDSMQNYKKYAIPKAQLVIADIPFNIGTNFYGSNPMWYNGGDNKNGESKLAGKAAFNSDFNFNLYEYFHFCSNEQNTIMHGELLLRPLGVGLLSSFFSIFEQKWKYS